VIETISVAGGGTPPPADVLLDVRDLRTYFSVMDGTVPAVDGISFQLKRGDTLGLVGESGCGKSVTALTIMQLLDIPPAQIASGEIWFEGRNLLELKKDQMRHVRGKDIAMIFQEPLTSLNPVFTVGDQIAEQVQQHLKVSKKEAWDRAVEALRLVGIPSPERRAKQYPHEMSGGMRQRVMIAMALSCEPKLLIADEPTTALDVTIQAQILELLKTIQERTDSSLILITHDLGVVAEMVSEIVVMYAGQIVEQGTVEEVLLDPKMPYTMGLIESIPDVNKRGERLSAIKGVVPSPFNLPPYCRFEPRCPYAWDRCSAITPELFTIDGGRLARCHLHAPGQDERRRRVFAQAQHVATEEGGETFEGILLAEQGGATPGAAHAANASPEGAPPQATTAAGAGADTADGANTADPAPDAPAETGQ
jgi:oligopeptide transport system ATP-binding protein